MQCEVIVDIAHANVDKVFAYQIPEAIPVRPGHHVLVPFGAGSNAKEGFVVDVFEDRPHDFPLKAVSRIIEPYPVLLPDQIDLARWIQQNYHCLLVDALRLMIPAQLRGGRVRDKLICTVAAAPGLDGKAALSSLCGADGKPRAPKQYEILELLLQSGAEMDKSDLLAFVPNAQGAITALVNKGYAVLNGQVTFRRPDAGLAIAPPVTRLNEAQTAAIEAITGAQERVYLLHGVTGSGKTEVYMRCIEHCRQAGKSAVMLVPEISLTPQTVGLFRQRFSDDVAVLHSRLSAGERFDEWRRVRLGKAHVVVGARSAVFAPVERLGLIVIDEEHEPSYQSENTPRYHALSVAKRRVDTEAAILLLGSATPSLTSYFRAKNGLYYLLELPERVQQRPMPPVETVDMRAEFLAGNNGIFSTRLIALLKDCLDDGKQAMFFLNRRGYSTFVSCRACGEVVVCPNCDISMTYHKTVNRMKCHFCGATQPVPRLCPACQKPFVKYFGAGTEQVEERLRELFPDMRTLRMDTDTMHRKGSVQKLLAAFAAGEAQVLIGTQMIAKGHDFPNVTLVGVVMADAALRIPDYRSGERAFQLLEQVSGRAGRDKNPGRVIVQTYSPGHPIIRFATEHDYKGFYAYELAMRRRALFPPFSLFIRLLFSGSDEAALSASIQGYARELEAALKTRLGEDGQKTLLLYRASEAPIRRLDGQYRYQILIKLLRTNHCAAAIRTVYDFADDHRNDLFALVEINPQDML